MEQVWIFQVNAGHGMPKQVLSQAAVTEDGIEGDGQRNQEVHGGKDRALCLFSLDRILALQKEGHPIYPGAMGENLTLAGLDWDQVVPGVRLKLGAEVIVEITSYTAPCSTVQNFFKDKVITRASQKKYPGWSRVYARVLQPGQICIGDRVEQVRQTDI